MRYAGRYLILDRVQKGDSLRALLTNWLQRTRSDKFKGVGMNSELRRLEEQLRKALEADRTQSSSPNPVGRWS
jgi:hypothetical protein